MTLAWTIHHDVVISLIIKRRTGCGSKGWNRRRGMMSLSSPSCVMFRHPIKIMVQVMFFKFLAKMSLYLAKFSEFSQKPTWTIILIGWRFLTHKVTELSKECCSKLEYSHSYPQQGCLFVLIHLFYFLNLLSVHFCIENSLNVDFNLKHIHHAAPGGGVTVSCLNVVPDVPVVHESAHIENVNHAQAQEETRASTVHVRACVRPQFQPKFQPVEWKFFGGQSGQYHHPLGWLLRSRKKPKAAPESSHHYGAERQ